MSASRHTAVLCEPPGSLKAGEASRIPCLYRINSITPFDDFLSQPLHSKDFELSTKHKKASFALALNVESLIDKYGVDSVGFLTLTFGYARGDRKQFRCYKRAAQLFNSLRTNVLDVRYKAWMRVMERHKDGVVHYHLLVVMNQPIRNGFDFQAVSNKDYSTVSQYLKSEWAYWRKTAKSYGFGRTELYPIKSSSEAMAKYVSKYISKHMGNRLPEDKGARLVGYSKAARTCSTRFQFLSDGSAQWRAKIALFAAMVAKRYEIEPTNEALKEKLGKYWVYRNRHYIMTTEIPGSTVPGQLNGVQRKQTATGGGCDAR